ncbi:hypothetical protein Tdes44962_MAKER06991 [Teratosphaeria destructans]|uniref:Uncharacterized protein n=1 Tax=Teratosphaeria destructans TaxID=418781 RepID=A0A9W7T0P0_9PEZI|nr:hypothetical protein Tdes44962_MAKER06991 [Teratosphaeria destructans]
MKSKKDHEKQRKDRDRLAGRAGPDPYSSTVSPPAPRDEFRPRRQLRGHADGGGGRRGDEGWSGSYSSAS